MPGPRSEQLARVLSADEAPNCAVGPPLGPVVWAESEGMSVRDVDGNVFLDGTGGFGTALVGHGNPRVVGNAEAQARRCAHGLADVHATETRVALVQRLAERAPDPLESVYLAGSGSEAVEIALKTAWLRTGRRGVVAYAGAYHGVAGLAAACTDFPHLREPFAELHSPRVHRLPFPDLGGDFDADAADADLARLGEALRSPPDAVGPVGAVILEPVQYRGGARAFPTRVLRGAAELCREHGALLVADEVATGCGRTGRWFASQGAAVVPDLLVLGKGLGGGWPIAACVGSRELMSVWQPADGGEALHTSTALGHPVSCAAACAVLAELTERELVPRAAELGTKWLTGLQDALDQHPWTGPVRGYGMLLGVPVVDGEAPSRERASALAAACLQRGLIVIPDGPDGNVLIFSPPLTSAESQATAAIRVLNEALEAVAA